jgi:hypothetical protein
LKIQYFEFLFLCNFLDLTNEGRRDDNPEKRQMTEGINI